MDNENKTFWSRTVAFVKRHPILFNIFAIILTGIFMVWLIGVVFLGWWTNHGDNVKVPQVKGLTVDVAANALRQGGFEIELDSIYDMTTTPGTVVEQSPRENSTVKHGRTIYLMYVCYNPKLVKVPNYLNMSRRQAIAAFESVGINNITIKDVVCDTPDLVLGARYNGLLLNPGKEIPVGAAITLEVGSAPREEYFDDSASEELITPEDADAQFIESLDLDF